MSKSKSGPNRWGCDRGQGVCRIHKGPTGAEPLICRHGCKIAKIHDCADLGTAQQCRTPECHGIARSRGGCALCRKLMQDGVDAGEYTWDELVNAGAALPVNKARRPSVREERREYFRQLLAPRARLVGAVLLTCLLALPASAAKVEVDLHAACEDPNVKFSCGSHNIFFQYR